MTSSSDSTFPEFPTLLKKPLSEREMKLLTRARQHAADFATRAAQHDRENSFPLENYDAMKQSGYAHMTLPEELGGEGVNLLELCACQEQLAQGCSGTAIGVNMHIFSLGSRAFDLRNESAEIRARGENELKVLGKVRAIFSGSFSESGVPGAYNMPQTKAKKVEGGWLVNGKKSYNSNVPAADYVGALVMVEDPENMEEQRVAMLMLPKNTPGIICYGEDSWDVIGMRASGSWDIEFKDVFVPDNRTPPTKPAMSVFADGSSFGAWFGPTISSVYLGVAQAMIDLTKQTLKSRKPPTEERPLSHMPGLQYQLAEMVALAESSRALIHSMAEDWMARPWSSEESQRKGALCKYITSSNHIKIANLAMDIAGGPGLFRRSGLERLYRDMRPCKAHYPGDMLALETIAKTELDIPLDFKPRWG